MNIKLRNMTSLYLVGEGEILCLYRIGSRVVSNKYIGSAGGHFEPSELNDPKICILREMEEELGLKESDIEGLELRYITHRLVCEEIRQNYYFFARLKQPIPLVSTEGTLRWIPFDLLPQLEMPVSAKHVIRHYLKTGRFTKEIYAGITEEAGTNFVALRSFGG